MYIYGVSADWKSFLATILFCICPYIRNPNTEQKFNIQISLFHFYNSKIQLNMHYLYVQLNTSKIIICTFKINDM